MSEHEGIHTLQIDDSNVVLAFEDSLEARRFAAVLEAQEFYSPVPSAIDPNELLRFCDSSSGVNVQFVPTGTGRLSGVRK